MLTGVPNQGAFFMKHTQAMLQSPRCGARTRKGISCRAPAVYGRKRCRLHGGADGSGAPKGNKNAIKSGYYTTEEKMERRNMHKILKEMRETLKEI